MKTIRVASVSLWTVAVVVIASAPQGVAQTPPQGSATAALVTNATVPLYPAVAEAARLSGQVRVIVTVRDGIVKKTEPMSVAHQILVSAATQNIKTWKFRLGTNTVFETTYVYEIEKDEAPVPENPHVELSLPFLVKISVRPAKPTCSDCGSRGLPLPQWQRP